jgi:hypothetical protein
MEDTRRKLLENFDAEVHDRLKINMTQSKEYLDRFARMLWAVTKHELGRDAKFNDHYLTFMLKTAPEGNQAVLEGGVVAKSKAASLLLPLFRSRLRLSCSLQ